MKISKYLIKNKKQIFILLILSIIIILIASGIDFLTHSLSEEYSVPSRYFPNKILYGGIFIFLSLLIFRKQKPSDRAIIASIITTLLLQVKYAIEGYPKDFVILFLFVHFTAILLPAWIILNLFNKYTKN